MIKLLSIVAITVCIGISNNTTAQVGMSALPHVLVYKTKSDYRNYVPVMLSADKKTVVSYPDPKDVKTGSGYPLPVLLHKGYLLDKRGVGKHTAFLKITYPKYAALSAPPTPDELYNMILDKDPITEIYDCGLRNPKKNSEKELNLIIDRHQLKKKYKEIK